MSPPYPSLAEKIEVNLVKIDVTVLLKIQKITKDAAGKEFTTGYLYGLYNQDDSTLEVTRCLLASSDPDVTLSNHQKWLTFQLM